MGAAILTIGTEVVRGEIENTNTTWLCDRITSLGTPVGECVSIPDEIPLIVATLQRLAARQRVIVATGGLGPTTDDLTTQAVAATLGVPLVRDDASLEHIKALFTRARYEFSESNAKQADFPAGALVLQNSWGTAPGFSVRIGDCLCFFLPGVPREMKPMFERHIEPQIRALFPSRMAQIRLRTFGGAESAINDRLKGVEAEFDVVIGYRANMPQVEVKALAQRDDVAEAERAAERAAEVIEAKLSPWVYGRGTRDLPQVLGDLLQARGWSLGLAESCTGGLLSELITREPASSFFRGTIVCYANEVKSGVLGVPQAVLEQYGAVSEQVVEQLAKNVCSVLGSSLGIAVSGIAGPDGGTPEKPVGLVYFGVNSPLGVVVRSAKFTGDRRMIQLRAAFAAMDLARQVALGS